MAAEGLAAPTMGPSTITPSNARCAGLASEVGEPGREQGLFVQREALGLIGCGSYRTR